MNKLAKIFFVAACILISWALFAWLNYGQEVLAAAAKKPVVTDPTKSVVGKDPCYNYVKTTTLSKTVYNQSKGGRPLFKFYGNEAKAGILPYGGAGTIVAAGNVAAGGGTVNFGTLNNGTAAKINSGGELDFYVKNGKIMTLSNTLIKTEKGLEVKGDLKAEKIYLGGKEVKAANINGKNILYADL